MSGAKFSIDIMEEPEGWYHLGNMYWCPEYHEFYQWLQQFKLNVDYDDHTDFPHHYFSIVSPTMKQEFDQKWSQYIQ